MIVKNESAIIEKALASVVDHIDYYVICDTGSTDNTREVIKNFFDQHGIQGEVPVIEFRNFEYARNKALECAQKSEADFDYILLSDADMELRVEDPGFRENLEKEAYMVLQKNDDISYFNDRLVRKDVEAFYEGVTHEVLRVKGNRDKLPEAKVWFFDHMNGANRVEKYERDIRLLTEGLKENPDSPRYLFYMAQSYFCIHEFEKAIEYYQKRVDVGGWAEEVYYSMYMIGLCERHLERDEGAMVKAFIDAFNYRSSRAEPLFELANYYRRKEKYSAGYLFAKTGAEIPYPEKDILFVSQKIYDYLLLDELSVCAFWSGRHQESLDLCDRILASGKVPSNDVERIQNNRQYAVNAVAKHEASR